jgi:hypothetical protein
MAAINFAYDPIDFPYGDLATSDLYFCVVQGRENLGCCCVRLYDVDWSLLGRLNEFSDLVTSYELVGLGGKIFKIRTGHLSNFQSLNCGTAKDHN